MKTFNRLLTYFKYEPLKYAIGIVLSFVSAMTQDMANCAANKCLFI